MKKFTVVGYNYGLDKDGEIQWFEVGKVYPYLSVKSQGGWETGCRDYGHQTIENVRCVAGSKGSPHCCGEWTFEKAISKFTVSDCNTWVENRCTLSIDCRECKDLELIQGADKP